MRQLIILRGPQGSGRRNFARQQGVSPWMIDQGDLEPILADLVSDVQGNFFQDGQQRGRARRRVLSLVSEKASRGNLIVFQASDTGAPAANDAPSSSDRMITSVIAAVRKHRYRTLIVDFTNQKNATDLLHARTGKAPDRAEEKRIQRQLGHMARRLGLPEGDDISWYEPQDLNHPLVDLIEPAPICLDRYEHVIAVGDIHGCRKTLHSLVGARGLPDDAALIFLGDYINKGPDSGGVLKDLIDRFAPRENCFFLTGNHERPLEDWVNGEEPSKKIFAQTSLPTFAASGITPERARAFLDRTLDGARFSWRGLDILATHGGFSKPPKRLALLSSEHLQYGTESAVFDVDRAWEDGVLAGEIPDSRQLVQIHGHRNPRARPIAAGAGTFNLENGVEQGGDMRAVVFSSAPQGYVARTLTVPCLDPLPRRSVSSHPMATHG